MKKKPLQERYAPGAEVRIEMFKPEKGNFPIARNEEGIICLIKKDTKGYFQYNSIWTAEVVEVHEKKLIVKPIECLMSAAANAYAAEQLAKKAFAKEKPKKEKVVREYQYERKS